MSLNADNVKRIARLARLNVAEADLSPLAGELNKILSWVEKLNEVNVEGVAPMTSVVAANLRQRADVVTDGGKQGAVLQNAPAQAAGFFAVPKVVE